MTSVRWVAALLGLFLAASNLPAQGVFISYPAPYYGYPVRGPVFGFGRGHGRHGAILWQDRTAGRHRRRRRP